MSSPATYHEAFWIAAAAAAPVIALANTVAIGDALKAATAVQQLGGQAKVTRWRIPFVLSIANTALQAICLGVALGSLDTGHNEWAPWHLIMSESGGVFYVALLAILGTISTARADKYADDARNLADARRRAGLADD